MIRQQRELKPDYKRVVRWGYDEVTSYQVGKIQEKIEELLKADSKAPVTLEITSPGGNVNAGFALIDWLFTREVQLVTVAYGEVNSMAIPIYLTGKLRLVAPHASFYLHQVQRVVDGKSEWTAQTHLQGAKSLNNTTRQYSDFVVSRVPNLTVKKVSSWMRNTRMLSAREALELGFAHELSYKCED